MDTYKEKIQGGLARSLLTTQINFSSNSYCGLNCFIVLTNSWIVIVSSIHNFDPETQLALLYDEQIETIYQLSNHHELENHVHAKTCAVHYMWNHACAQVSFALFLSIEETESKPFTFQIFAMVPKLTGQNITTGAI